MEGGDGGEEGRGKGRKGEEGRGRGKRGREKKGEEGRGRERKREEGRGREKQGEEEGGRRVPSLVVKSTCKQFMRESWSSCLLLLQPSLPSCSTRSNK
jgi:hypothetical protein